MRYTLIIAGVLNSLFIQAQEKFSPKDHVIINYTQVMLKETPVLGADHYVFNLTSKDSSFQLNQIDSSSTTIVSDLDFGQFYSWKVQAVDSKNKLISTSNEHHFRVGKTIVADTTSYRFNIMTNDLDQSGEVIFVDYTTAAIDRNGKVVWFLTEVEKGVRNKRIRDVKMTHEGTITFITEEHCYEITLDGQIVWKSPKELILNGDTLKHYHHEFTKLQNGNYLTLMKSYRSSTDLNYLKTSRIPFTVAVEINGAGEIVWHWDSYGYFYKTNIFSLITLEELGDTYGHANSIVQSADDQFVLISFRLLNAVYKINKGSKSDVIIHGQQYISESEQDLLYKRQHAATPVDSNRILLFNNNINSSSKVMLIEIDDRDPLNDVPLWIFECDIDTLAPNFSEKMGNVQVLPNGNYLVNMGKVNRIFEVNDLEGVIWNCLINKWNGFSETWEPFSNYRSSWSSSLYPYEFSVCEKINSEGERMITIFNEGSEKDTYLIAQSSYKMIPTVITIEPGYSYTFHPNIFFNKKSMKKGLDLEITSKASSKTFKQHFPR